MSDYKEGQYIVAFIDILGSSAAIREDSQLALNDVHNAYNQAVNIFDNMHEKFCSDFPDCVIETPQVRIFSDNIVIYKQFNEKNMPSVLWIITLYSSIIQGQIWDSGFLSRGGIAMGDFFADELMIWGNALLDAYELESKIAIYPRIVIHPNLTNKAYASEKPPQDLWVSIDKDGLYYADPFHEFKLFNNPQKIIEDLMEFNNELISKNSNNLKILVKLYWFQNYLEEKLTEYKENNGEQNA